MSKRSVVNAVAVGLVILLVVGTAWWKNARPGATPTAESTAGSSPAPRSSAVASRPARSGSAARSDASSRPAARSASQPASAPAARLPRLIDLGADKCKACKDLAPILEALRKEYEGRLIVEFHDVWKDPAPARKYGVRLIPTQILLDRDGREVWRHEGFVSKEELVRLFAEKVGVR